MKRRCLCLLFILVAVLLAACGEDAQPAMYIEPAQLTQAEQNMAKLLGEEQRILDFQVDETVQVLNISVWELKDGAWDPFIGGRGGRVFTDPKGRIALDFDHLGEGFREALQSENYNGSTTSEYIREPEAEGTHRATSFLEQRQEIRYEEEIPLAVQIVTTRNEIRSFDPSYFYHPEEYAKYGYEHVYAVTIRFSQQPLSD